MIRIVDRRGNVHGFPTCHELPASQVEEKLGHAVPCLYGATADPLPRRPRPNAHGVPCYNLLSDAVLYISEPSHFVGSQTLSDLEKYNVPGRIEFQAGDGGMIKAVLRHESNSQAEVYLLGATVSSFRGSKGQDVIYLSSTAIYREGKALRGGIPICWPQFSDLGQLGAHGLVRNKLWTVVGTQVSPSEPHTVSVTFRFTSNEETRASWPHDFRLYYTVELTKDNLNVSLDVVNDNQATPFTFTAALHSYFNVSSIGSTWAGGLQGCEYLDNTQGRVVRTEPLQNAQVRIDQEVDRIYLQAGKNSGGRLELHDDGNASYFVRVVQSGFPDAVLWNPWAEKTRKLADMPDSDYQRFACIESTVVNAVDPAHHACVPAGGRWRGVSEISVVEPGRR